MKKTLLLLAATTLILNCSAQAIGFAPLQTIAPKSTQAPLQTIAPKATQTPMQTIAPEAAQSANDTFSNAHNTSSGIGGYIGTYTLQVSSYYVNRTTSASVRGECAIDRNLGVFTICIKRCRPRIVNLEITIYADRSICLGLNLYLVLENQLAGARDSGWDNNALGSAVIAGE